MAAQALGAAILPVLVCLLHDLSHGVDPMSPSPSSPALVPSILPVLSTASPTQASIVADLAATPVDENVVSSNAPLSSSSSSSFSSSSFASLLRFHSQPYRQVFPTSTSASPSDASVMLHFCFFGVLLAMSSVIVLTSQYETHRGSDLLRRSLRGFASGARRMGCFYRAKFLCSDVRLVL